MLFKYYFLFAISAEMCVWCGCERADGQTDARARASQRNREWKASVRGRDRDSDAMAAHMVHLGMSRSFKMAGRHCRKSSYVKVCGVSSCLSF